MLMTLVICLFATADGVTLYQQRDFSAAESELRRSLAAQPSDAKSRLYLARTLVNLGRIPEALEEISRALAGQTDSEIVFEAGRIVRGMAEERFADLERIAPDSAAVHELAAYHLEQQGKLPEALQEYRAAIAKEPGRPGLHYEAGNILWRMREVDAATAELQAELARTPHHGLANLRLGQVFLNRNKVAEAVVCPSTPSMPCPSPLKRGANWERDTAAWAARPTRGSSGRRLPVRVRMTIRCIISWGIFTGSWATATGRDGN